MVRNYVPTGRPAGRPKKVPKERLELSAPSPVAVDASKEAEDQMRGALAQVMTWLHTEVPRLLQAIARDDPKAVLSFYRDMAEYQMPKLARNEQVGTLTHNVQHFVAVEDREIDPRLPIPLTKGIDYVEVEPSGQGLDESLGVRLEKSEGVPNQRPESCEDGSGHVLEVRESSPAVND